MKRISRRKFIRNGMVFGGFTFLASTTFPKFIWSKNPGTFPDIVSAPGDDPLSGMESLLEPLGGVGKFVKAGESVGFLANSPWKHPGTATSPDVVLAAMKLFKDAGCGDIICFKPVPDGYWQKSRYYDEMKDLIDQISYGEERVEVEITGGKEMKTAEIFKNFLEVDRYVSIPVAKHHNGTVFSGNLKGLMGVSSSTTNRHMHSPDGKYTYDLTEYLSKCIADLNLIRLPDLCIMDAVECVTNNGPRGPGDTTKPNRILAGVDPVAMDVYASNLIGFDPEDVLTNKFGAELGLGKDSLDDVEVVKL